MSVVYPLNSERSVGLHSHSVNKLNQAVTHETADTDVAPTSLHHTLGSGANQAAPGNHTHVVSAGETFSAFLLMGA